MNQILHPIEPEELMAYLDGELTADRASATATHLSECSECQTCCRAAKCFSESTVLESRVAGVRHAISNRNCAR